MKYLFLLVVVYFGLFAQEKTPLNVFSESMVLKKMLVELRKENGINSALNNVSKQYNKSPRHVLQKTLEILSKVNKYREIFEYIEFHYNRVRSYSYLGNLSPSKFEEINLVLQLETAA